MLWSTTTTAREEEETEPHHCIAPLPAQVRRRFLPEPGLDDPPATSPYDAMHLPQTQQATSYLFRLAAKQEFSVLCSLA